MTGLAGAAALAGSTQAYGAVVNINLPSNITGSTGDTASTKEYFNIQTGVTSSTSSSSTQLEFGYFDGPAGGGGTEFFTGIYVATTGGTLGYYSSYGTVYAYPLAKGTLVGTGGPDPTNQHAGYFTLLALNYAGNSYGFKTENEPMYIGFQFTASDGQLHDGWLELESTTYTSPGNPGGLEFLGGAYNTTPDSQGGTILVGQTAAVPEPGTLAALAAGAAALTGVGLKRRQRQRAATLAA